MIVLHVDIDDVLAIPAKGNPPVAGDANRVTSALIAGPALAQNKPLKLTLNFLAGGPQAGFMYAKKLGLYDKAGINLTIEEGKGSATVTQESR